MALLRLTRDGVEVRSVDLEQIGKQDIVIGRAESADVRLDDRAVGRSHALLRFGAKGVAIQKMSKFGKLTVNGQDIAEALIRDGDVIHLADYAVHIVSGHERGAAMDSAKENRPVGHEVDMQNIELPAHATESSPTKLLEMPGPAAGEAGPEMIRLDAESGSSADAALQSASAEASLPEDWRSQGALPQEGSSQEAMSQEAMPAADQVTGSFSQGGDVVVTMEGQVEATASLESGDGDQTKLLSQNKVLAQLLFKPGESNVEVFEVKKGEASIGRGSNCDIVLADKKASRKHAVLKRVGAVFMLSDQGSANGTYVNGESIAEKELQGDDLLRIGDTEFIFKAVSKEYEAQKDGLLAVPGTGSLPPLPDVEVPSSSASAVLHNAEALAAQSDLMQRDPAGHQENFAKAVGPELKRRTSLFAKFRAQPPLRRYLIMAALAFLAYYGFDLNKDSLKGRAPASSKVQNEPENAAFNSLPNEKRQFVVNTYQFAFDLYTQEKYEEALYEIRKVLQVLPNGYKQSKDIESYAQKAIEQLAEQAERRRKKENEEKVRSEVASLVGQAQDLVDKGEYAEARGVFSQILERDPENPTVQRLKSLIEEKEEQAKAAEETKRENLAKKEQLQAVIEKGRALLKAKKYYSAIDAVSDAAVMGHHDEGMLNEARGIAAEARRRLAEDVKPLLEEAQSSLVEGNLPKARDAFLKALKVDYKNAKAKAGLEGVRATLIERARRIYTEALVAEGVSNYKEARSKYKKCLQIAMADDIYHGRCERKYKRFDFLERSVASEEEEPGAAAPPADAFPPRAGEEPQ